MVDKLVEGVAVVEGDSGGLLDNVSEALSEGEALEVGVTSDDDDTDVLGDSLLEGV